MYKISVIEPYIFNQKLNFLYGVNYSQKDFTKLLSSHDLVISSSGLVSYELAFLGLPSIFIASETWENSTASYLEKNGFGVNYGFWNNKPELLKKEIFKLDDFKKRELMYLI